MSKETISWLNLNTLIGFTDKRGHAWHYKAAEQGQESNHYTGAIPVADVERRLFNWTAVEGSIVATHMSVDGVITTADPDRKAIMRSDTGAILGIFKNGYEPHQYTEWLLNTVATILDDSLSIGSTGLLKGGARRNGRTRNRAGKRQGQRSRAAVLQGAARANARLLAGEPQGACARLRRKVGDAAVQRSRVATDRRSPGRDRFHR